jgi:hypothetical protein
MKTTFLQKGANAFFAFTLLAAFFTFTSCGDQGKENARKSLNDFKAYVKEHKDATANYMDTKWEDMEKEYDQKKNDLDKNMDKMDQEMKESYQATVADWETFKAEYQMKQREKEDMAKAEQLKATIIPTDIHTDLSNVTGKNVVSVFEHFVNTVDNQKEMYSKEEWVNINNYWKSLNDLSGRLDDAHEISKEDGRRLDGLRIKYAAIKTLNKPFAESENK